MREILEFCLRFLFLSVSSNRRLRWFLEAAFVVVAVGLVSALSKDADLLMPFGISAFDLSYLASLGALLSVLALVVVPVIGIPLFRYSGVLLMLAGIGVFEYQVYEYMKLGWWQSFPLRDFTDALFLTWTLDQSTGWPAVLLRNFLQETALSIFLIAIGALWHALAHKFLDTTLRDIRAIARETLTPDEKLPVQQAVASPEPANAETFNEVVPPVAEPIILAEAKLLRADRSANDSPITPPWPNDSPIMPPWPNDLPITPPWLADEDRDAGAPAGVTGLRRRPAGK
jgi:hypothetical protein